MSLGELIEANNDATLEELTELFKEKTGVKISRATMGRMTQRLKMSVKKKFYPDEKETATMQKLRLELWEKIRDIRLEDLVFIDEAGVNLTMVRLYARALKGRRAYGSRPHKRGKNVSMIGAIALTRVVAFFEVWGAVDGITFEAFIVRKLIPKL